MPRPLSHIRVLDLSRVLAGPWASQNLADLGAEVLKIERPGSGDDTRSWGPPFLKGKDGKETRESAYFLSVNRGKKSVTLDISKPEGQRIARALAGKCDVLIENYKVGGLAKYGLAYEDLRKINSRIIYCSITGFGQSGPSAHRPGYDFIFQGMGGLMSITGERDSEQGGGPQKVGIAVTDVLAGMYASLAITAAIAHRERTGAGQYIDLALLHSIVAFGANQIMNRGELIPLVREIIKRRASKDWIERLEAANVPCGPINSYKEVFEDSQVAHRKLKIEMPHPLAGTMPGIASPMRFSETPVEYKLPPPLLGQHTREILGSLLGLGNDELDRLAAQEII